MFDINNIFLFNRLKCEEKAAIVSTLPETKFFKKGEVIYSAQNFSDAIGIVVKGEAFAVTNNTGNLYMKEFKTGSLFGAAAIFGNGGDYVSTVIARTDTQILFITERQLEDIFGKYPQTALNYIEFLSDRIRFLNKKLGILSSVTSEETLFNYLNSIKNSENIALLPSNMTLLSKTLGISRASLYRSLDNLEKEGFILKEKNTVKVKVEKE